MSKNFFATDSRGFARVRQGQVHTYETDAWGNGGNEICKPQPRSGDIC